MDYLKLKLTLEKKGYKFFESGDFDLNFIWVRNDYHATNHFTDDLHIAYKEGGIGKVLSVKCTTKPGLKGSLLNPITVDGVTGTDVIVEGQYRGTWEFRDTDKEFSTYPYFRQVRPINYFRDGDKDLEIDHEVGKDSAVERLQKIDGTQWHRMSNINDKREIAQFEINNWSLGCMGCPIIEWDKVIELTRKSKTGFIFTGTIINGQDLV